MNIIGIQLDSVWENKPASHERARALIEKAAPPPGALVVLPEMFATGFSMNVDAVDDGATGETQTFLAGLAAELGVYLLGGVVTRDAASGRGRNEAVVYDPTGREHARYHKMQPFTLGGESAAYEAGKSLSLFAWNGFTVAPFICYDLRFPEHFRQAARNRPHLFAVIANWPATRIHHWTRLLQARAIENQSYVAGVNRTGSDPSHTYNGQSALFSPEGTPLCQAGTQQGVTLCQLDLPALEAYRSQLPFLQDMRQPSE